MSTDNIILNSKGEFNGARVPRITLEVGSRVLITDYRGQEQANPGHLERQVAAWEQEKRNTPAVRTCPTKRPGAEKPVTVSLPPGSVAALPPPPHHCLQPRWWLSPKTQEGEEDPTQPWDPEWQHGHRDEDQQKGCCPLLCQYGHQVQRSQDSQWCPHDWRHPPGDTQQTETDGDRTRPRGQWHPTLGLLDTHRQPSNIWDPMAVSLGGTQQAGPRHHYMDPHDQITKDFMLNQIKMKGKSNQVHRFFAPTTTQDPPNRWRWSHFQLQCIKCVTMQWPVLFWGRLL